MSKQVSAVFLMLIMLFSTTGITLSAHFCGGALKNMALFQQSANGCKMAVKPACPAHAAEASSTNSECCEDFQLDAIDDQLDSKLFQLEDLQQQQALGTFSAAYLLALLVPEAASKNTNYLDYSPPVVVQDIPVLVQSFLL